MVHMSLSAVDLNLLVVLRALLTERHVTRAAVSVGLSQSATSHALARLRELYDDPLLVRHGRGLELTPRARALLPTLERGLADLKAALSGQPDFDPSTARQTFTLGMADYTQAIVLGPLLRALESEAPGIDLVLLNRPDVEEETSSGNIDLGLNVAQPLPANLQSSAGLFSDEFVCLIRKDHPKIGRKLTLQRYLEARHVVVAPTGTSGSLVDSELERRGLARRVAVRVGTFLVAPLVVSQTDFINTMPRRLALQVADRYGLRILPPPLPLPSFGLMSFWHARLEHDASHRWLRELVDRVSRTVEGECMKRT